MIIPRRKLVFWSWLVFPTSAFLCTVAPESSHYFYSPAALFCLTALIDAVISRGRLKGIVLSTPDIVKASTGRLTEIHFRVHALHERGLGLRVAIGFPQGIASRQSDITLSLPPGKGPCAASWPIMAIRAGKYRLGDVFMETSSSLGFWNIRIRRSTQTNIYAYPNLLEERKGLASLFLRTEMGQHLHRRVGKGRDFDQLRDYIPGDHFSDIHWKATAKRHRPVTKTYQIQRAQQVYLIIDASRLSSRSMDLLSLRPEGLSEHSVPGEFHSQTTILERFVTAALVMVLAAQRLGDMFGILTFADQVNAFASARSGKVHYDACRDMLFNLAPSIVSPDFSELFRFIGTRIRRRSLLVFLTNLDDRVLSEDFVQHIHIVSRRHLVIVNTPRAEGAIPLFTSADVEGPDDLFRHLSGHLLWEQEQWLQRALRREGIRLFQLEGRRMCSQLVSQYLEIKQRQLI